MTSTPLTATARGVRLAIRLTPRGGVDRIDGVALDAGGRACVRARVAAPAEAGRANASLVRLLARSLDVPASRIAVVAGAHARSKQVEIAGEPGALLAQLLTWVSALHGRSEDH
jgi:hypothetical protein